MRHLFCLIQFQLVSYSTAKPNILPPCASLESANAMVEPWVAIQLTPEFAPQFAPEFTPEFTVIKKL